MHDCSDIGDQGDAVEDRANPALIVAAEPRTACKYLGVFRSPRTTVPSWWASGRPSGREGRLRAVGQSGWCGAADSGATSGCRW